MFVLFSTDIGIKMIHREAVAETMPVVRENANEVKNPIIVPITTPRSKANPKGQFKFFEAYAEMNPPINIQ